MERTVEQKLYELQKRIEWFVDGYFIHCLRPPLWNIPTERIVELYNVKMSFFRPCFIQ